MDKVELRQEIRRSVSIGAAWIRNRSERAYEALL
jgi:hypothetical protein